MLGFPFDYGDELDNNEAARNRKSFLKKYGRVIVVNGVLFLISSKALAVEPRPGGRGPKDVVPGPPAAPPVFTPIMPPSRVLDTKIWSCGGVASIGWICLTAAATRDPALIVACTSLVIYAIGGK